MSGDTYNSSGDINAASAYSENGCFAHINEEEGDSAVDASLHAKHDVCESAGKPCASVECVAEEGCTLFC